MKRGVDIQHKKKGVDINVTYKNLSYVWDNKRD